MQLKKGTGHAGRHGPVRGYLFGCFGFGSALAIQELVLGGVVTVAVGVEVTSRALHDGFQGGEIVKCRTIDNGNTLHCGEVTKRPDIAKLITILNS